MMNVEFVMVLDLYLNVTVMRYQMETATVKGINLMSAQFVMEITPPVPIVLEG